MLATVVLAIVLGLTPKDKKSDKKQAEICTTKSCITAGKIGFSHVLKSTKSQKVV